LPLCPSSVARPMIRWLFRERFAVGFYGYTDGSEDGVLVPVPSSDSEPAAAMRSCDPHNDYALHLRAEGFVNWGAGVGMEWGGPPNPSCEAPGALDCLQIGVDDMSFSLADAEEDPRCDTEEKLECLMYGKNLLEPRDLGEYEGIGFWVLATEDNEASSIHVNFPIPDTMRFYGECSEEDGDPNTACFNDYYTTVSLSASDVNKWVFKTVMFYDLAISPYWGLQLGNPDTFPTNLSMGIMLQIDVDFATGSIPYTDLYFDDLILMK
jgi:hypothetical protein